MNSTSEVCCGGESINYDEWRVRERVKEREEERERERDRI